MMTMQTTATRTTTGTKGTQTTATRACLLLHGFTGGPYEVKPLAEHLAACGYACAMPTLPGHDGPLRSLHTVRRDAWLREAEAAAAAMTERFGSFDLVGFSMGGLIAGYLANRYPVRRLALLNTAVYYVSPGRFVRNAMKQLKEGNWRRLSAKHGTPLGAVVEFTRLVRELKPELARIKAPTLIAQGELDEVVHPRSASYIASKLKGKKEVVVLPNSQHMICLGPDSKQLFGQIERFFIE
ncbi:alpha/beta fold hydrolase [Paenibacillus sp. TRM 82003]|nr:alpha/beta fold hydrolase [Paenibacillus sp. TRM 82003]